MREFVAEALVLGKEPSRELDLRVTFFAKQLGKFTAKAKSARRILSKLSPHLEPGSFVRARFIEKGSLQVIDALQVKSSLFSPQDVVCLSAILGEGDCNDELWEALQDERGMQWQNVLRILGWDPFHARCEKCTKQKPERFDPQSQRFFCVPCASRMNRNEVSLLYV